MKVPGERSWLTVCLAVIAIAAMLGTALQAVRLHQMRGRLARLVAENAKLRPDRQSAAAYSIAPPLTRSTAPQTQASSPPVSSPIEAALHLIYARSLPPDAMVADIEFTYARFLRKVSLGPDELGQFDRAIANHQRKQLEIESVASAQHLAPDDPTIVQLEIEERTRSMDELRTVLGRERFEAFESIQENLPMRAIADELASQMVSSPTPLTPGQAEALTSILSNAAKSGPAGEAGRFDWNRVIVAARRQLSPPQVSALEAIRDRWVAEQQLDVVAATAGY